MGLLSWFQAKPTAPLDKGFQAVIRARFPPSRFFLDRDMTMAASPLWREIFARYPHAPAKSVGEEEAAAVFFAGLLKFPSIFGQTGFVSERDGLPYLAPKQEILDFFAAHERWVLRSYFAATGRLKWTEFRKANDHFMSTYPVLQTVVKPRRQITPEGALDKSHAAYGAYQRETAHYHNQEHQAEEHYRIAIAQWNAAYTDKRAHHIDQWGVWFFNQLELALKSRNVPDPTTQTRGGRSAGSGTFA